MPKLALYKIKLLNEFECRDDDWNFNDLESRLKEVRSNMSYHDAKFLIKDAHKDGRWPKTVKRYLQTNYDALGSLPSELNEVGREVYASLTEAEKKEWKI